MAAGLGTRLRPFSDATPKPLLPLMGIPLIQYTLDLAAQAHVSDVVINLHHRASHMQAVVPTLDLGDIALQWSDESDLLRGSGGGIQHALGKLGDRFFALNSDTVCKVDLEALALRHTGLVQSHGVQATFALMEKPARSAYAGIFAKGDFVTQLRVPEGPHFFVGAAVFEATAFDGQAPGNYDLIDRVVAPLAAQKKIGAFYVPKTQFLDIGSPIQWAQAHFDMIETGAASWNRVRENCVERAPGVWTLRSAPTPKHGRGPAFWGHPSLASGPLGPRAVVYDPLSGPPWELGIWHGSHWVPLPRE